MRDHLEADERQIENQIGSSFSERQCPIKVSYLYVLMSKVKHESRLSALTK